MTENNSQQTDEATVNVDALVRRRAIRGSGGQSDEDARILNHIISTIKTSGNRKPGAILYLGYYQMGALKRISDNSLIEIARSVLINKDFYGWRVVEVKEKDFCKLAA